MNFTMNRISYRQLQSFAKAMKLPGNMKYQVLWDMVSARKAGNERRVGQLMAEQKRLRFERRMNRKVARTLEDNNLRLAQLSATTNNNTTAIANNHSFNNNNDANHLSTVPVMEGSTTQEIVIDSSGQAVLQASHPPHTKFDYSKDLKMAHLLDTKVRHDVMTREIAEYRKALQLLPVYQPNGSHDIKYQPYQLAPVTPCSASFVPNSQPRVPLAHPDAIQEASSGSNMSQMIGGPNYEYKQTGEPSEREVGCYQDEDMIEPVPSTSYALEYPSQYSNAHLYSGSPYYAPAADEQFARYKMYDHEGYQRRHSVLPDHNVKSQMNDPYDAAGGVSPNSDTQSADELDNLDMTFEDEQYAGFEPYIEEVISSQPFEPEHSLPPSHIFKSEETVVENSDMAAESVGPNEKIIVEIGAKVTNHSDAFPIKKERIDPINQDEENCPVESAVEETEAPGALLTSSELCPTTESSQPDLVDDGETCDTSSPDGELEIVLPEDVDDVPAEENKSDLLIRVSSDTT